MSSLSMKDIENILNETARNMFSSYVILNFRINEAGQFILMVSGGVLQAHPHLKHRIISKKKSDSIINAIRMNSSLTSCFNIMMDLLNTVTVKNFNWSNYINLEVNVDKEIIDKAKIELKDHIEGVNEFLLESIKDYIKLIDLDSYRIDKIWKENIRCNYHPYEIIEDLDSLKSYSIIKEDIVYPYLILSCKTGSIKLTENSSDKFLKVENNKDEINKLKVTEEILGKCYKNMKKFAEVEDIITVSNILTNLGKHQSLYNRKFNEAIRLDLIKGELRVNSKTYDFQSINLKEIENEINNVSIQIQNKIEEELKAEAQKKKERFNQPFATEIINLINDFPKKGITTYVSILAGEKGDKITSNKYDKSTSYATMSSHTKTYIAGKIREYIQLGLIEECQYKASFGRYIGLSLSKDSINFIKNNDVDIQGINIKKEIKIENFKTLLHELKKSTISRASALLIKASSDSISFEKEDFDRLLKFIEKDRALYRDYEDTFNSYIAKIVPEIYKPLFLLNANLTSGVNKKTLKSIYDNM